jgi:hypothetical protein
MSSPSSSGLGPLSWGRYRFILEATTPLSLSGFAGATLRGGFGHRFKEAVCVWPPGDCGRCLLQSVCAYPYVFETAPPPNTERLRGLTDVPRPFVLEPPEGGRLRLRPGERFAVALVLIGKGVEYLPYFLFTFQKLGDAGLGRAAGRFRIAEVEAEQPTGAEVLYRGSEGSLRMPRFRWTGEQLSLPQSVPFGLRLQFLTPTRIRSDGAVQSELTFADLIRAVLRRLSSLCVFHCGGELPVDFRGLIELAGRVQVRQSELCWHQQRRFSGRQSQWISMSGLLGTVCFEADDPAVLAPFLPLLAAGEWLHVGKGSVMGLGKYRVEWREIR